MKRANEHGQRLLELARPGPTMPGEVSSRSLAAIERRAAAGDVPAVDVPVPSAAAGIGSGSVVVGVLAGIGVTAVLWMGARDDAPRPPVPATQTIAPALVPNPPVPEPPAPAPAEPPADRVANKAVPPAPSAKPPRPVRDAKPPTAKPSLEAELALLREAKRKLGDGRAEPALRVLDDHARRFPSGQLAQAREVERVRALCQLGDVREAQRVAKRFERKFPGSAYRGRVQAGCAGLEANENTKSRP